MNSMIIAIITVLNNICFRMHACGCIVGHQMIVCSSALVIFLKLYFISVVSIVWIHHMLSFSNSLSHLTWLLLVFITRSFDCTSLSQIEMSHLSSISPGWATTLTGLILILAPHGCTITIARRSIDPCPFQGSFQRSNCSEAIPKRMIDNLFHGFGTCVFPTETFRYQFHTIGRCSHGQ